MLVLNTNKWWDWWFTIANQDIIPAYPNPEWNILMAFTWRYDLHNNTEPTNYAFDVNWTKVHSIVPRLILPNDLAIKWNNSYNYPPSLWITTDCPSTANTNKVVSMTIWLENPFEAWNVIWKRIIFPKVWIMFQSTNYLTNQYIKSCTYKISIIHSDWTKTTIATQTATNDSSTNYNFSANNDWNTSWYYQVKNLSEVSVVETAWYTTIDWDYLVVEISFTISKPSSATPTWWIYFWWYSPCSVNQRLSIFQVSVE